MPGYRQEVLNTTLAQLSVLDVRQLTEAQTQKLAEVYDSVATKELLPFPQMAHDPVRAEIDSGIAEALGLPDFSILRTLLAQEPVVSMKRL